MHDILQKLQYQINLSAAEMRSAMLAIMNGGVSDKDICSFLSALNSKGFTVEEVTSAAMVMREYVVPVQTGCSSVFDIVGTGGDAQHSFNISTAAAFVIAAAGVKVAKHGNRSVSSLCGSADVLEALGINIAIPHEYLPDCLNETGIIFLFAQRHHPAMKHVAPARQSLGVKTIFNVLGPLTNPAFATHQMMGVYSHALVEPMAHVLKNLGAQRVVVVHSTDGLDEVSTASTTFISEVINSGIRSYEVTPESFGFTRATGTDFKGGNKDVNAVILRAILSGEKGPKRDIVVMNAAFGLYGAGIVDSPSNGVVLAERMIDSGEALHKLEQLKEFTNRGC
ncbi:MAG: anthranilate phosphoribosyltransferase [Candidatus Omnitrophota bacterium]